MTLADRVEMAGGPDRKLDAEIAAHQGLRVVDEGHPLGRCCYDEAHRLVVLPRYTASLDAAMSLGAVTPWLVPILNFADGTVRLVNGLGLVVGGNDFASRSESMACALVASWLRARAALGDAS